MNLFVEGMENVSLQFQRGIIMEKQNWKFYWKWSVFVLMTMLCLLSFYKSYQNVKYELQEESQTLFSGRFKMIQIGG